MSQFKVWKTKEYCMYFSFFKLKKWGKKAAETRRHNCAVLPYIPFVNFRQADASSRRVLHDTMGQTDAIV